MRNYTLLLCLLAVAAAFEPRDGSRELARRRDSADISSAVPADATASGSFSSTSDAQGPNVAQTTSPTTGSTSPPPNTSPADGNNNPPPSTTGPTTFPQQNSLSSFAFPTGQQSSSIHDIIFPTGSSIPSSTSISSKRSSSSSTSTSRTSTHSSSSSTRSSTTPSSSTTPRHSTTAAPASYSVVYTTLPNGVVTQFLTIYVPAATNTKPTKTSEQAELQTGGANSGCERPGGLSLVAGGALGALLLL